MAAGLTTPKTLTRRESRKRRLCGIFEYQILLLRWHKIWTTSSLHAFLILTKWFGASLSVSHPWIGLLVRWFQTLLHLDSKASSPGVGWRSCTCRARGWPPHRTLQLLKATSAPTIRPPSRNALMLAPSSSFGRFAMVNDRSPPSFPCSGHTGLEWSFALKPSEPEKVGVPTAPQSCSRVLTAAKLAQ